ncbi:MAG: hypothetical protein L0220_34715 [Acidobacteria bacterium]|nr:hypothetical protein [Acidobacteriota bacterium]
MKEHKIEHEEALLVLKQWQENTCAVEVRLRYSQGLIQSHSGYVRVEPEGRVVIAQVADSDLFYTTVIDVFAFDSVKMIESGYAITFAPLIETPETYWAVTIACLQR